MCVTIIKKDDFFLQCNYKMVKNIEDILFILHSPRLKPWAVIVTNILPCFICASYFKKSLPKPGMDGPEALKPLLTLISSVNKFTLALPP